MLKAVQGQKRALIFGGLALVALSLSACVSITEVSGPYKTGQATWTLDRSWNDVTKVTLQTKGIHLLTLDGPVLNSLYLSRGLKEGDYLVRPERRREKTTPAWRAEMGVLEQVEFVSESVEALGYTRVVSSQPRPVQVAGQRGVRFDLVASTDAGLDIKGYGQVVSKDGLAYVAIYLSPTERYFEQTKASALSAMDSLTF